MTPQLWHCVQDWLKAEVGAQSFDSWLGPLDVIYDASSQQHIVIEVPTRFVYDWVLRHYSSLIERGIHQALECQPTIEFRVKQVTPTTSAVPAVPQPVIVPQAPASLVSSVASGAAADVNGTPLDPRFTFDNFVTGKSNEFAYAAAKRIAESTDIAYNPFILHGGVGLGKTHLMHAIAWHIKHHQPGRRVTYISSEKFLNSFVRAMRDKSTLKFKDTFRNTDVLMIDDVQFIAGKEATQEEFFHTFNALINNQKQIILTADQSPHEMQGIEERLRSRLGWGLATEIHKPDLETRLAILQQKAGQLGMHLPPEVAMLLAGKIESNIRELEGALNRLAAHATLVQTAITPESTRDILKDLFRHMNREVAVIDIQKGVCEHYHMKMSDIVGARRTKDIARARQVAMYLCKQLTSKSFPDIGKAFGGRDHTTVMHAAKKIEELIRTDTCLDEDVRLLTSMLKNF